MAVGVWLRGRISQRHFQAALSVALLRFFERVSLGGFYLVNLGVALFVASFFALESHAAFGVDQYEREVRPSDQIRNPARNHDRE